MPNRWESVLRIRWLRNQRHCVLAHRDRSWVIDWGNWEKNEVIDVQGMRAKNDVGLPPEVQWRDYNRHDAAISTTSEEVTLMTWMTVLRPSASIKSGRSWLWRWCGSSVASNSATVTTMLQTLSFHSLRFPRKEEQLQQIQDSMRHEEILKTLWEDDEELGYTAIPRLMDLSIAVKPHFPVATSWEYHDLNSNRGHLGFDGIVTVRYVDWMQKSNCEPKFVEF